MCSGFEFYYSSFLEARSLTKFHSQLMDMLSMLDHTAIGVVQRQSLSEQVSEMTKQSQNFESVKPVFGHILSPINGLNLGVRG